ncbi:MAG: hypothetical protein R2699_10670 [Acidimicrobiales bacterium]
MATSGGGRWDAWLDRDVPPSAALGASVAVLALDRPRRLPDRSVSGVRHLLPGAPVVIAAWYVGRRPASPLRRRWSAP